MLAVEKQIARKIVNAIIDAGYSISVDDDEYLTDVEAIIEACDAVDECHLFTNNGSFVYFIWNNGNNGLDCITDYGLKLEPIIAPISEWIDSAELILTEEVA